MTGQVNFCGASGQAYAFTHVDAQSPWARIPGVALFAAPAAYGLRVVKIIELSGRPHDVKALWALHDAERFGAEAVFIAMAMDPAARSAQIADLEAGLSPVCAGSRQQLAVAA